MTNMTLIFKMSSVTYSNKPKTLFMANTLNLRSYRPADLTVRKRPGTSYPIEINFAVFNRLHLLFFFIKIVETW